MYTILLIGISWTSSGIFDQVTIRLGSYSTKTNPIGNTSSIPGEAEGKHVCPHEYVRKDKTHMFLRRPLLGLLGVGTAS